jgi:hypothetical protein
MALLAHGIKQCRSNEILHPREKPLELVENPSTSQSELETIRRIEPEDHPETLRVRAGGRGSQPGG